MSKKRSAFWGIALALAMTGFLFFRYDDARASVAASCARCVASLIPGLFPMMILSKQISFRLSFGNGTPSRMLSALTGFSRRLLPIFAAGLLCGYPLPAILCAEKYKNGELSEDEAAFALSLCDNASPAFLFFCVGSAVYRSPAVGAALIAAQTAAVVTAAHLFRCPPQTGNEMASLRREPLAASIAQAARSMLELCGFVVFFSLAADLLYAFAAQLGFPLAAQVLSGCLEITGGVAAAASFGEPLRSILVCFYASLGGLSVYFQIASVTAEVGNIRKAKCFFSVRLCVAAWMFFYFSCLARIFGLM